MKKVKYVTGWTDYPFVELGDEPYKEAPVRQVTVVAYGRDKYATVTFVTNNMRLQVKTGYLYSKRGRFGQVPQINVRKLELSALPYI
jgi:hypothetical protein